MPRKQIKTGVMYRSMEINRADIDEETRTVRLAFSSEHPVERWFGNEILDHGKGSVRLERMRSGGPLLMDHERQDHVGVVEGISIDADRVGRSVVRFGSGTRASEIFTDVIDGIRRHVSVGYRIHRMVLEEKVEAGETYRITDWEPLEISLVAMPADTTVGIGRDQETQFETIIETEERVMPKEKQNTQETIVTRENEDNSPTPLVDINRKVEEARHAELGRIQDIEALAEAHGQRDLGRQFIAGGKSLDEFRGAVLEAIGKATPAATGDADTGLTGREVERFSFLRALNALANPADRRLQEAAAFEFDVSASAAQKLNRESRGITVPPEVLRQVMSQHTRDLSVGTAADGGHTVSTDLLGQSFIEMLRNRTVVFSRATQLLDLVGNIAIPRQTGGATAYWVAEGAAPTESQQIFDQVSLSPETVGAFTDFSRKLLLQSSIDIEAFVRGDLATVLGLEIDRVCINGSGTGSEPLGILGTTGIGDVAGGTNGLAPNWDHMIELESDVAVANADVGALAYVVNAKTRGKLKRTEKFAGTNGDPIWDTGNTPLNGYLAETSNQVPTNLSKGTGSNLSAILFGNFTDLIVGLWGGLDLMVDPYTGSTTGTVRVVALQDIDLAVRHAGSFAAMQDAITT